MIMLQKNCGMNNELFANKFAQATFSAAPLWPKLTTHLLHI